MFRYCRIIISTIICMVLIVMWQRLLVKEERGNNLRMVAVSLTQPQSRHDLFVMKLPRSLVGHGSSGPSWPNQEV